MFKTLKSEMMNKAHKLANPTYSVPSKSCNKLLMGKTYWKNVVLPSILFAINVIYLTNTEIEKLQRIENSVYRKILGATKNTVRVALRGEIGASAMKTRIVEGKLQYLNSVFNGKKEITKKILMSMQEQEGKWWKSLEKSLEEIDISIGDVKKLSKVDIKTKTRTWDDKMWKAEVENKDSLYIYKKWKLKVKEEVEMYDNTFSSVIFFRARTNSLLLNRKNRHTGGNTRCCFCENVEEDLIHFILFVRNIRKREQY